MHLKKLVAFTFLLLGCTQVSNPYPTDIKFTVSGENAPFIIYLYEPDTLLAESAFTLAAERNDTQEIFDTRNKQILELLQSQKPQIKKIEVMTIDAKYTWYYSPVEDTKSVTMTLQTDMSTRKPEATELHPWRDELLAHGTRALIGDLQKVQQTEIKNYLSSHAAPAAQPTTSENRFLNYLQSTKAKIVAGIVALAGIGALYNYFTQKPKPAKITEASITNNTRYPISVKDKANPHAPSVLSVLSGNSQQIKDLYDAEATITISDGKNSLDIALSQHQDITKIPQFIIRSASLYERYIQGKDPLQVSVVWHPLTLRFNAGDKPAQ